MPEAVNRDPAIVPDACRSADPAVGHGDSLTTNGLIRLMTWLSPAFPTGAFAYSHGLETAYDEAWIVEPAELETWLGALVERGSGWNDAVLCAAGWRQSDDGRALDDLARLGEALAGSAERHLETIDQGAAFVAAARPWQVRPLPDPCPLPIAVGAVAAQAEVMLPATLAAYLQAFTSNLVQAAQRLGRLGQVDGIDVLIALEPVILETAARATEASLDDLGSATILADITAMRHETAPSRIFRS